MTYEFQSKSERVLKYDTGIMCLKKMLHDVLLAYLFLFPPSPLNKCICSF